MRVVLRMASISFGAGAACSQKVGMDSPVLHGGALDEAIAAYGGSADGWLDLSTGINPIPYPVDFLPQSVWHRLPDTQAAANLIDVARTYYNVPEEIEIVSANGTQPLIGILPALLSYHDVAIVSPTYGEHFHVWEKAGRSVSRVSSIDEISGDTTIAVVVNPNNPDCRIHDTAQLNMLAARVSCLVVDEAFADTLPQRSIVSQMPDNVIVLKSVGKFFGLAGLRLGFAICRPDWAASLRSMMGPWSVSGPALAIGAKALGDKEWINETLERLEMMSGRLAEVLEETGFTIEGINPLFVFARHREAARLVSGLSQNHILVRAFPELSEHLRFGLCRNEAELERLRSVLKGSGSV